MSAPFSIITCSMIGMIMAETHDREMFQGRFLKSNLRKLRPVGAIILILASAFFIQDAASSRFFPRNGSDAKFGVGALEIEYPMRGAGFLKSALTIRANLRI